MRALFHLTRQQNTPDSLFNNNSKEMKKQLLISISIIVILCTNSYSQYWDWETRYTPTGEEILGGVLDTTYELSTMQKEDLKDQWLDYYDNRITFLSEATRKYNCHGYAWHMTEGTDTVYIYTPYDDDYWTAGTYDASYKQVPSYTNAKVSFSDSDHSAIRTGVSNVYISKWGNAPKFQHNINDCPYTNTNLKYYKLDPKMTGSTSVLCYNVQRTFETNITHMTDATLTWTKSGPLTYVSGGGTSEYIVKGGGNGDSSVDFEIDTPSGFSWSSEKEFWAGKPVITNKKVDGGTYYTGMQICPGDHYLSVTPDGDGAGTASWTVPYGITYFVGINTLDFTFPSSSSSVSITANSANTCGTGPNSSFYLTKKNWGCGGYYMAAPNPAENYTEIDITSDDAKAQETSYNSDITLTVVNKMGAPVMEVNVESLPYILDTSKLPKGEYIIQIISQPKDKEPLVDAIKLIVSK
jgi:hypothetical protein